MKNTVSSFLSTMTSYTAIVILGSAIMSCSHAPKKPDVPKVTPVALSANTTPTEEFATQKVMFENSLTNQVDVLAPVHYDEAVKVFNRAQALNNKGEASDMVLQSLSLSRAHLNKANEEASVMKSKVEEVTSARAEALKAGARNFPAKLGPLDMKLRKYTDDKKGNISDKQKTELQNAYLALELSSIKTVKLINTQELLAQAKTKGAKKTTPQAYTEAISKYNIADKLIETDRHNNAKIDAAVTTANIAATRVMSLLTSEQTSRNQTPEQRAMTLEARDNALKQADADISSVEAGSLAKSEALAQQGAVLAISEGKNQEHQRKEIDEQIVKDAAAKFSTTEAEVYRQDGLLIIRLKSMNFASGRSDLPADSVAVLTKVKEVIQQVGPGQVTVQGHTDAVGAQETNQKLSQNRAQAVEKFFEADTNLENSQFESIGYGYSKPLASNKTKIGRAQNRRVDVVIKTNAKI